MVAAQVTLPIPCGVVVSVDPSVGSYPECCHQRVKNRSLVAGKQVNGSAVCGKADGLITIGVGCLFRRPTKRASEHCAYGFGIIRGPRIEHAGVDR